MIDTLLAILMGLPYLIVFTCICWWALVSTLWYLLLIPFWIGSIVGFTKKDLKYPLIGFAVSWFGSWVIALIAILTVKF